MHQRDERPQANNMRFWELIGRYRLCNKREGLSNYTISWIRYLNRNLSRDCVTTHLITYTTGVMQTAL